MAWIPIPEPSVFGLTIRGKVRAGLRGRSGEVKS